MKSFSGKVAAITGAGSGIGQATAIALAKKGCHLAISDISQESLEKTIKMLAHYPVKVSSHVVDVSDREAVYKYADDTVTEHGKVNIIMNNAGVGLGETVENMSYENFEWLMNINFWGVVYGTKAFLPHLKRADEGHIINISSVFGIIGVPTQSAYNAAKFAVRGFTESLREELDIEGGRVSATSVHPGGVKTNIARNSRMGDMGDMGIGDKEDIADMFEKIAMTTPETAAKTILKAVRKNRRRVLVGGDAIMLDTTQRLMPTGYQRLLEVMFKKQQGKNSKTARKGIA
ncbi:MAG: acetoin dehydrogenase [Alcanivorax borkumensis]|jgi:short-subunit dehydrogenase|uniref:Short chain dehydrogenase, putative n=1 Tax=Alcanivorax borkumensis (strain ATCC 700651 / DSM 11573 / NCIMB 13689 / SK2) TaxID=393595 RepID=Q0VT83_ALCBS|nr:MULTISPECIES: SDR family NAD(P)-dependent oxidoreductase [Alcanivorax]OJH08775.1 MAG: acetoin dehydrogenase [Alcanivorax borkumensis]EUC68962.1 short-chain dehydrogenase [Alcanivorax sp. 97CO-5]PKG01071.1 acetoin dehydrogenase [Alcanivorax sp. 97CO-6]CAL15637.1 short chain dehydrogenase, putative [Alcanivorax borkumensis SK2]BAP13046.1 putative short-chain dehydrogenase [Alcanivorax sp. NBRC 101098]